MSTKLLLKYQLNNEEVLSTVAVDIPIAISFVQSDVREPDKKNSSSSKTITIHASSEVNKLFEFLFDVNIKTQYFNPNKKTEAIYLVDEVENFRGYLQITNILKSPNNLISYNCQINGNEGNLFIDIGDKLLTDLDYSEFDHTYNRTNILNSVTSYVPGQGYYYPFIDNGLNGGNETEFITEQFLPALHVNTYLKKIVEGAGYEFSISSGYERHIVTTNVLSPKVSDAFLLNNQCYVGLNSDVPMVDLFTYQQLLFNKESTPFFDAVGNINTSGVFTVLNSGNYNINLKTVTNVSVTNAINTNVDQVKFTSSNNLMQMEVSMDGGATWYTGFIQSIYNTNVTVSLTRLSVDTKSFDYTSTAQLTNVFFGAGSLIRFKNSLGYNYIAEDTVNSTIESISDPINTYKSGANGCSASMVLFNNSLNVGSTLTFNSLVPQKIKQRDFLKSIMQAHNLFLDVDKYNPKKIKLMSYYEFFNIGGGANTIVDWNDKIDLDKDVTVNPLFLLNNKTFNFKYKEDKDYYNQKYLKNNSENFGTNKITIDNDFVNGENTNELIFSPTPNNYNTALNDVYPKIYDVDENGVKSITPNIRLLYAKPKTFTNSYKFYENGSFINTNIFGYAGHTDDPINPTVDLNFDTPKEVFYSFPLAAFTTNNLYNKNWKGYLDNIINRDSKVLIAYLWLTPLDIYNFSFRNKYLIDGAYYFVNKIIDYNPYLQTSTKVELIKIINFSVFAGVRYPIVTLGGIIKNDLPPEKNPPVRNVFNNGVGVKVINSSGIFVDTDSSDITLINCKNVVTNGLTNFVGINLSNVVLDSTFSGKSIVNDDKNQIKTIEVIVTSAELLALNVTPKLILPYSIVEKRIINIEMESLIKVPYVAYSGTDNNLYYLSPSTPFYRVTPILTTTAPTILGNNSIITSPVIDRRSDLMLGGSNSTGTFDIKITITYYEI